MIISHQHRYVFVQLPHTACTAVGKELCDSYGGEKILWKHSTYREFERIATADEREFYVFSSIRNPLEVVLTKYHKYLNQRGGGEKFDVGRTHRRHGGWVSGPDLRRYQWVVDHPDASFSEFFKRFYRTTYDNWSSLDHHRFDRVIRYESLQSHFEAVLDDLGLDPVRPLPVHFRTPGKSDDLGAQFALDVRARAAGVLGPFMEKWGYSFPDDWAAPVPPWRRSEFRAESMVKRAYWASWKTPRGRRPAFMTTPVRRTPWVENPEAF